MSFPLEDTKNLLGCNIGNRNGGGVIMSIEETKKHIALVMKEINIFISLLEDRGWKHDASKLEEPEAKIFEKFTPLLKDSEYGSQEYKQFLKDMKPAIDHHYAINRHHPKHFKNGVDGMNLVDVIEMFCDWKAAVKRHKSGDIVKSIEINAERFNLSSQLTNIFLNSV